MIEVSIYSMADTIEHTNVIDKIVRTIVTVNIC